jgi:23S rRNA pseudouridine2604 synthase
MCQYFDYEVVKLERIQVLNIKLGNLGQGNWRNLTSTELEGLFDLLEESEKTSASKKKPTSNKAYNKALSRFDVKNNYRKGSLAARQQKKDNPDGPTRPTAGKADQQPGRPPQKKKQNSAPRVGKSRAGKKKNNRS